MKSLCVALCWAGAATLSIVFTRQGSGIALIWPANAVLVATLLIAERRNHTYHIIAVVLASLLVNLTVQNSLVIALCFALNGVGEACLAAWLIARLSPIDRLFDSPANIFRFSLAAALACIPSALGAALLLAIFRDQLWWQVAISWMPAHGFGLLIFTPLLLIINQSWIRLRERGVPMRRICTALAMFGLVAAVTTLVFRQTSYSLAFLIVPALLVATFHLRAAGAAGSVMIIAFIGSYFVIRGNGPFALIPASIAERTYVMETFIATMFMCALPLAAVLNERDRLIADTNRHLAAIHGIADRIGEVLFRIDERGRWLYLNSAYQTVTGRSVTTSLGRSMFDELPEAERARVMYGMACLLTDKIAKYSFATTMPDADGAIRHVEFDMFRTLLPLETGQAVSGVFRDVTARTLLDAQLRESAVRAKRAARRSERVARTDDLTLLPNRRAFFENLEEKLAHRDRFALAVFDVDHFKRINDSYGHPAGDEVLRQISATAAADLRDGDMVARIGGEEFAILFSDVDPDRAALAANRLVTAIAGERITLSGAVAGTADDVQLLVTISMGLTQPGTGDDAAKLLADADRALYAAKHGGRNQLRIAA